MNQKDLKPAFKAAADDEQINNRLQFYKRYLKQLYKLTEYKTLISEACCMFNTFPTDLYPLEWICKVYCENYKTSPEIFDESLMKPIDFYANQLLQSKPNSTLGLLIKAIKLYESEQFPQARNILEAIKEIEPTFLTALELLAFTYIKMGAYGIAISIFQKLKYKSIDLGMCLSFSQNDDNLNQAVDILKDELVNLLNSKRIEYVISLARAYFGLKKSDDALTILEKLSALGEVENAHAKILKAEFASSIQESLQIIEEIDIQSFEYDFLKGKILLQSEDYDKALDSLLKATQQKPYFSECFFWLGKIYFEKSNLLRARKCFEKCSSLNPQCEESIVRLSAIYKENNEWDLNGALLKNSLKYLEGKKSKCILFHLGLHYLSIQKYDNAIDSFRAAIRFDLNNVIYWECLADSYQYRGSYNSAMRVYQKILEINPENSYAKLQVGAMKLIMYMYEEAIECFNEVLESNPNHLAALKGAAEANYGIARKLLSERLLGRCKVHLQEAINYLQRVFEVVQKNMIWLWRLIANIFVMVACLPTSKANLNVSGKLSGREENLIVLERKELFEFAARFYTCAIKLQPDDGYLWHELSICYYKFGLLLVCEESTMALKYLQLAFDTSKQAIKTQPGKWQNWNLFGIINATKEINDLALAQHCFIKALQLDKQCAVVWSNLGVLYLNENSIKLANQAFQKAQQSNPLFLNAWIGQAIIAETIGEDEESMDLFRHCTQLDFHLESALGYGHWVSVILSDSNNLKNPKYEYSIEKMHAIPLALDSMNWYINTEELNSSIEALTYLGFLNSKHQLWGQAIKAYKSAVKLATPDEKDKLLCNLGFSYLKNKQYQEAIETFNAVSEATLKSTSGLALAYFNAGNHEKSYFVYNSALEWLAGDEAEKATLLAAMTPMIYAAHGEAATKTVLFQCLALSNAPVQALFATCALGILHSDFELSTTILQELQSKKNHPDYFHHVAFLTSQLYAANKQINLGLLHLLKCVHICPNNMQLRAILTNYLLHNYRKSKRHLSATCQIAQGSMILGLKNTERQTSLEAAGCLVLGSRAMRHVDRKMQLKLAQRALHLNPNCKEAWIALNKSKN